MGPVTRRLQPAHGAPARSSSASRTPLLVRRRVKGGARVRVERGTERAVVKVRDEADEAEQLLLGLGELLGWGLRPHITAYEGALAW